MVLDEAFNIEYKAQFPTTDELSFDIPYMIMQNYKNIINPHWKMLKGDYLILLNKKNNNTIVDQKYFIIINPKDNGGEKEIKSINCYSLEYELNKKQVRNYKMTARKLYSLTNEIDDEGQVGILNYITTLTSWSLDTTTFNNVDAVFVDSKGIPMRRAVDISEATVLDFLVNTVQKTFGCIFFFDTVNKKISIYKVADYGTNKGLYISESNYIKTINHELQNDEIVTRLYCYGKDDISIESINPTGTSYIEDFTFYKTTDYMSQSLIDALNTYETKIKTYLDKIEDGNPLIDLGNSQYKIICNSYEANAFKAIKEVKILSNNYIVPLNKCTFNKVDKTYIGDDKGKISVTLDESTSNKEQYTIEVRIAQTANADMSVVLNGTDLLITLGTGTTAGVVDDSKNLTMYISGAINTKAGFHAINEINGKLSKVEAKKNLSFNNITIDGTGLNIYPSNVKITYLYDTFKDLRNELLDLQMKKRVLQTELDLLFNGYYEENTDGTKILIKDGLYEIQDKINIAIKNSTDLSSLNSQLSAKELEICNKQAYINHTITNQEIKDILNKHPEFNINNVPASPELPIQNQIDNKQLDIFNYRNSISKTTNFTTEQLVELDSFIKEKSWTDSAYEDEEELYLEGVNQIAKLSTPPLIFDIDVVDFLSIVEGKLDKNKLILGDLICIGFDKFDLDIEVRLVGYTHEIDNHSLKLKFSNKSKIDDATIYLSDVIKNAVTSSTTINMDKYKWDQSVNNTSAINDIINNALDASKNAVLAGKNQDVQIKRDGIHLVEKDDSGVVLPEQMRIISNRLVLTKDNWVTASTAVTPQGVWAESFYGKAGVFANGTFEGIEVFKTINSQSKKIIDIGKYTEDSVDKYGIVINSYTNTGANKGRITLDGDIGIKAQKYNGSAFVDQLYFDNDTGDLKFTGDLTGASGTFKDKLAIGSGNSIFKVEPGTGMWLGNTTYENSPWHVNMSGQMETSAITIQGSSVNTKTSLLTGTNAEFNLNTGKFRLGQSDTNYKMYFDGTNLNFSNDVRLQFKGDPGAQGGEGPKGDKGDKGDPGNNYPWVKETSIDFNGISTPSILANYINVNASLNVGMDSDKQIIIQGGASGSNVANIRAGKDSFSSNTAGFWMGWDTTTTSAWKYHIGNNINYLKWDGSELLIKGKFSTKTDNQNRWTEIYNSYILTKLDDKTLCCFSSSYSNSDDYTGRLRIEHHGTINNYLELSGGAGYLEMVSNQKIFIRPGRSYTDGYTSPTNNDYNVGIQGGLNIGNTYYNLTPLADGLQVEGKSKLYGNVGIGGNPDDSDGSALHVYGNVSVDNYLLSYGVSCFHFILNPTDTPSYTFPGMMYVDNSGNMHIYVGNQWRQIQYV